MNFAKIKGRLKRVSNEGKLYAILSGVNTAVKFPLNAREACLMATFWCDNKTAGI